MRRTTVNVGFLGRNRGVGAQKGSSESREMVTKAVEQILVRDYRGLSFERLFSNVYKTVMEGDDVALYDDIKRLLETHMRDVVLRRLLRATDDGTLLRATCEAYKGTRDVTQMVGDILMFLFNSTRKQKLESVESVQNRLFATLALRDSRVAGTLTREVVEVMAHARTESSGSSGSSSKGFEVHNVCAVLLRVGEAATPRRVYETIAERPYLSSCEEYCALFASECLAVRPCKECLAAFDGLIEAEARHAAELMDGETAVRVRRLAQRVLVEVHMDDLLRMRSGGLFAMLGAKDFGGLALVQKLVGAAPGGALRLAQEIERYACETCVQHQNELLAATGDEFTREQGIAVVDKILATRRDLAEVLHVCFGDDKAMALAAANGVRRALNADTTLSIPRFLSLSVDELVTQRARAMQETDFDAALTELLELFQELRNKDEFETFYKKHLTARLLHSANRENLATEKSLADHLGPLCCRSFAQDVESLLKEAEEGTTVAKAYAGWLQSRGRAALQPFALEVFAVPRRSWHVSVSEHPCTLPPFIQRAFSTFTQYYTERFEHRRLALVPTQGDATVRARFSRAAAPVMLSVSTAQMLILELFNSNPRIVFGSMVDHLGISERDLRSALVFLSRLHIVMRVKTSSTQSKLQRSDTLYINPAFSTPKTRLVCFKAAQNDKKVVSKEVEEEIAKGRVEVLKCVIVRIMKSRKILSHANLMAETIENVKDRFIAQPRDIDKTIDRLTEAEYIKRDEKNPNMFHYVSESS